MKKSISIFLAVFLATVSLISCFLDSDSDIETCTVTFVAGSCGSVNPQKITVQKGKSISRPSTTANSGWEFDAWYTTNTSTDTSFKYDFSQPVNESFSLYANWKESLYTITFNAVLGKISGNTSVSVQYRSGMTVTVPLLTSITDIPSDNPTFEGWYDSSDYSGSAVTSVTATENKTYYAKWTYPVTLNANGGSIINNFSKYTYNIVTYLPTVTHDLYAFKGWYLSPTDFSGSAVTEISASARGSREYVTSWSTLAELTWDFNEGVVSGTDCYTSGSTLIGSPINVPDARRTGYVFDGWYLDDSPASITTMPKEDTTYTAHWTAKTYKITLDGNLTTATDGYAKVEFDGGITSYTSAIMTGYDLVGYYAEPDCLKQVMTSDGNLMPVADWTSGTVWATDTDAPEFTLYASWTSITYTVTFDANGGEFADGDETTTTSYPYGESVIFPVDVEKTGYNFAGWFESEDDSDPTATSFTSIASITESKTYYAHWTAKTCKITLDGNLTTATDGYAEVVFDGGITSYTSAIMTGYDLVGYYAEPDCLKQVMTSDGNLMPVADWTSGTVWATATDADTPEFTLYASWTSIIYTVTFDANGGRFANGDETTTTSHPYGEDVIFPVDVETTGCDFAGWFESEDDSDPTATSFTSITSIAESKTYYAHWTPKTFEITLNANGGTFADGSTTTSTSHTYGISTSLTEDVTKEGSTFAGWYTSESDTTPTKITRISDTDMEDRELWAHWSDKSYYVTLDKNCDNGSDGHITVMHNSDETTGFTKATSPNHSCAGYYTDSACSDGQKVIEPNGSLVGGVAGWTSPDGTWIKDGSNIKLYAKWEIAYFSLTADTAGSTVTLNGTIPTLEMSTDDCGTWADYSAGTPVSLSSEGDSVYFRYKDDTPAASFGVSSGTDHPHFELSGSISAAGNIMSLVDKTGQTKTVPSAYCFYGLFEGCTELTSVPSMPATSLQNYCYMNMFKGCTSLKALPNLPAMTMKDSCYQSMFEDCSSIKLSRSKLDDCKNYYKIKAQTPAKDCVTDMFKGTDGPFWDSVDSPVDIVSGCYTNATII